MEKKQIIVLGGGGHAKVLMGVLSRLPQYEVLGFLDDNENINSFFQYKRIGKLFPVDTNLPTKLVVLGLGHLGRSAFRRKVIEAYVSAGYEFETLVAPTATVSPFSTLGKGVVIADGAIVQPGSSIGDYSILNTNAVVDHDCTIGKNVHMATGVNVSGEVKVGDNVLLGTGVSVIQQINIADNCIIGAGVTVLRNCDKPGIYMAPAPLVLKIFEEDQK